MNPLPFNTEKLLEICQGNDVEMVGVLGPVQGDIDLLVRFSKRKSLLDMVRLEREVSAVWQERPSFHRRCQNGNCG